MRYLFFFVLALLALSLQSLQAATSLQTPQASGTIEDALLNTMDVKTFESASIIGIGRIAAMAREQAPIQTLARRTGTQRAPTFRQSEANNRMGLRLFNVMNDPLRAEAATVTNDTPTLAVGTEIIDGDTNVDSVAVASGRMYTPRLNIDYQKFPIPTYANMTDEVQQKRMDKLNRQLQKRFGDTVKVDFQDNIHYLRGTIPSERQKEVLEIFIKMEPGIQQVQSEIVVRD